jgi:Ca2+-binding EF-hand superfamily protein
MDTLRTYSRISPDLKKSQSSMISSQSKQLSQLLNDPLTVEPIMRLSPNELKRIKTEFKAHSNKMDIMTKRSFYEYFKIEELQRTYIGERLYNIVSKGSSIDLPKFIEAVAILSKGSDQERFEFFFKIFDIEASSRADSNIVCKTYLSLINSMIDVDMDNEELTSLQRQVAKLTPQQREEAVHSIVYDMGSGNSSVSLEEMGSDVFSRPVLKNVLSQP